MHKQTTRRWLLLGGLLWSVSGLAQTPAPQNPQTPVTPALQGSFQNTTDQIQSEIDNLLGELGSTIMQGLSDWVSQTISGILMSITDSTPASEVETLRDLIKEGMTKQTKIDYQAYKLNYQENKAHMEISNNFADYYNSLKLDKQFTRINDMVKACENILKSDAFDAKIQTAVRADLDRLGYTDDLADEVRTVCNLKKEGVWMSEGDRVHVLDDTQTDLRLRLRKLAMLKMALTQYYAARVQRLNRNRSYRNLYNPRNPINGTYGALPTTFN